jgi:hypothetical protein
VEKWLPLNDYANKHQISVSTLRRRIKANKIGYKLDEGKYFIIDDVPLAEPSVATPRVPLLNQRKNEAATIAPSYQAGSSTDGLGTTRVLLDELKKAYLETLQSKEDQILYLKQQVSDLKTLVMLLEKENMKHSNEVNEL